MKNRMILVILVLLTCSFDASSQKPVAGTKVKTITEYNMNNKKREMDHLTVYSETGLKVEEVEYFSDGLVKYRTVYEYDNMGKCSKAIRYGLKGKVDRVTTYEYDPNGNRTKEITITPDKRQRAEKIIEYTYY